MTGILMLAAIAATIGFFGLAKRGRSRRKMGRYIRGSIDHQQAVGTLAAKDVIETALTSVVNERTLVSSVVASYSYGGFTPSDDDGPIMVGVAHSDYTAAQIEEFLEDTGTWNEGDKVSQEIGKRLIRRVGIFATPIATSETLVLNDGKPIRTKMNWMLLQGQTISMWVYNVGADNLLTGGVVHMQGHANLWPR